MNSLIIEGLELSDPLSRDLKDLARLMTPSDVRWAVDTYYQLQEGRKSSGNQIRSQAEDQEPHAIVRWINEDFSRRERNLHTVLDIVSDQTEIGRWCKSLYGIGPVIAAGLEAHIDIEKAPTVGHIWRFAGLDPTVRWEKGEKRPWNAQLKTLCWKIGECFVKFSNQPECYYGHVYQQRKALEVERNEAGLFADQAAAALQKKRYKKDTEAYKAYIQGKLPDAHVHARAKRFAVKLFLAHYHERAYQFHYGVDPPLPYPIAHMGHVHVILAP